MKRNEESNLFLDGQGPNADDEIEGAPQANRETANLQTCGGPTIAKMRDEEFLRRYNRTELGRQAYHFKATRSFTQFQIDVELGIVKYYRTKFGGIVVRDNPFKGSYIELLNY